MRYVTVPPVENASIVFAKPRMAVRLRTVFAIARFRLLTITRTGTPIFVIAGVPLLIAAAFTGVPDAIFKEDPTAFLHTSARAALMGWLLYAIILSFAALASGKIKTPHSDVTIHVVPDLMDTAPVRPGARFWGEALGTFGAALVIHVCCLPLLASVAGFSPLPRVVFFWIEGGFLALLVLASTGAAWQRRSPRTKYSASRSTRNSALFLILIALSLFSTTRWEAFRDALVAFLTRGRVSMPAWREVADTVDNPLLLAVMLAVIYFGNIAYYYRSATRKSLWEN